MDIRVEDRDRATELMKQEDISFVIFREGEYWVVLCARLNFATQSKTLDSVGTSIEHMMIGEVAAVRCGYNTGSPLARL